MKRLGSQLAAYACGHFWIDFSCALLLFSWLRGSQDWLMAMLLYNFCAFALQMPIGLLADRLNRNSTLAAAGCVLVFGGWLFLRAPLAAVILAGIGNACYHVGGGVDVLNTCEEEISPLGIFVSPGAMGIFLGTLWGQSRAVSMWIPLTGLVLFASVIPLLDIYHNRSLRSRNQPLSLTLSTPGGKSAALVLVSCFLAVLLQSYLSLSLSFPWKAGGLAVWAAIAVVLGKTLGGFLGDRLGANKTTAGTIGLSAVLFLASGYAIPGIGAIFLFHCSVPLLFWYAARLLPQAKGFSFGLLKFALFLGALPTTIGLALPQPGSIPLAIGTAVLLALLIPVLRVRDWR